MSRSSSLFISVSRVIAADAQALFDVLADPAQHPRIDGSGSLKEVQPDGPRRLSLGAKFGMNMHLGTKYRILNSVVEFDEPRVIAWQHFNHHTWRYRFLPLESVDGSPTGPKPRTEVTEEWDARRAKNRLLLRLLRFPRRNRAAMVATLRRLAELVER